MNREEVLKARDAYLAKLSPDLAKRFPEALDFYQNPENTFVDPNFPVTPKKNSRKGLTGKKAPITQTELLHLLKRVTPGPTLGLLNQFQGQTIEQVVETLLQEEELALPVNDYNENGEIDPDVPFGETFVNAPWSPFAGQRIVSLKSWFINELKTPTPSMHASMWLFWHNHLVTEMWGIFNGKFCYNYLKLLHDYAFGDFKELMYKITIDASMLIYLNGIVNNKEAPDENYGRELQELFCIGKGPDANYTEGDVQAAARVLTGWNINWDTGEATFYPWDHETADKQFSAFYGNKVIEGKTGAAGQDELQELIDMIFENNEVAPFICRKLYTYFVYATIDDWTEENVIQPLAETFRNNNYNIKPVLQQLFTSEHFYDEVNHGAIIKTPVDVLIGWWRAMEIENPFDDSDILSKMQVNRSILWSMSGWGMQIGDPPNVAGWPAYYQIPTYDKTWVTTSTIVRRIQYVDAFLWWGFWYKDGGKVEYPILQFCKSLPNAGDPNMLIADVEAMTHGMSINDDARAGIKSILLSGQAEDYYWTNAWNEWLANEDDETATNTVLYRLIQAFQRMFNLSEFQLK